MIWLITVNCELFQSCFLHTSTYKVSYCYLSCDLTISLPLGTTNHVQNVQEGKQSQNYLYANYVVTWTIITARAKSYEWGHTRKGAQMDTEVNEHVWMNMDKGKHRWWQASTNACGWGQTRAWANRDSEQNEWVQAHRDDGTCMKVLISMNEQAQACMNGWVLTALMNEGKGGYGCVKGTGTYKWFRVHVGLNKQAWAHKNNSPQVWFALPSPSVDFLCGREWIGEENEVARLGKFITMGGKIVYWKLCGMASNPNCWGLDIRKSGWHRYDQAEFVSSGQTGNHFSDIIK